VGPFLVGAVSGAYAGGTKQAVSTAVVPALAVATVHWVLLGIFATLAQSRVDVLWPSIGYGALFLVGSGVGGWIRGRHPGG
jgi:hypothetical protein